MRFAIALFTLSGLLFTAQSVTAQEVYTGDFSSIIINEDAMEIVPNSSTNTLTMIQVLRPNGSIVLTVGSPDPLSHTIDISSAPAGTYIVNVMVQSGDVDEHTISIN